jgi:hypothetical protein
MDTSPTPQPMSSTRIPGLMPDSRIGRRVMPQYSFEPYRPDLRQTAPLLLGSAAKSHGLAFSAPAKEALIAPR